MKNEREDLVCILEEEEGERRKGMMSEKENE